MAALLPRLYLLAYNLLQLAGWAVALCRLGAHVIATRSLNGANTVAGDVVGAWRTAACLTRPLMAACCELIASVDHHI